MRIRGVHRTLCSTTLLVVFCLLFLNSCTYYFMESKSLSATMGLILFMMPQYLEGPSGQFPYNPLGPEYAMYTMGMSKEHSGREMYKDNPVKIHRQPYEYDHKNKKVSNSLLFYLNSPDLYFEPDPEKSVIVLVSKKVTFYNEIYMITNDLCFYSIKTSELPNNINTADILGKRKREIAKEYNLELAKDGRFMTLWLVTEENCEDWNIPWFCDALADWKDIWLQDTTPDEIKILDKQ